MRYCGYYYDAETGFYYLITRYYDAEICRFLNADGYVSTGQNVLGFNMFAYCGNNPVMRRDVSGTRHEISAGPVNGFNKIEYNISNDYSNMLTLVQFGTELG